MPAQFDTKLRSEELVRLSMCVLVLKVAGRRSGREADGSIICRMGEHSFIITSQPCLDACTRRSIFASIDSQVQFFPCMYQFDVSSGSQLHIKKIATSCVRIRAEMQNL